MNQPLHYGLVALLLANAPTVRADAAAAPVEFNRDIRPILSNACFVCHGPDNNLRKAELRLDREKDAFADRGGYRVLVPGKPDESPLYQRITARGKKQMPPPKHPHQLTKAQIELLRCWVAEGAKYQEHWSLIAAKKAALPALKNADWVRNPIDRCVLARLEQEGIAPAPEADRRTLIRRLSFDLTGLPPEPDEVDAFVNDNTSTAYEKMLERLLRSPHFGERMAQHWLDWVRFADTAGYHSDNHRDLYLYRDYVIAAFNDNMPFDRFTTEQLAGDLLPEPTRAQRIASGYNRLLQTTEEGGAQAREYMAKYAADRVRNFSSVWLGMTMGCAECHDHKFDPFSTREFYKLEAFFADIQEVAVGRQPQTLMPNPDQAKRLKELDGAIAAAQEQLKTKGDAAAKTRLAELQKQKQAMTKDVPTTLISTAMNPRHIRILKRGNWLDDSGELVVPGVPAALPPLKVARQRADRLDLARWLVAADNPLTARVFVNRLWMVLFGQGIVKTTEDFGAQGAWPSHPDLLDWLAIEFRDSGWNVKHMIKLMATSATYRQSARASEKLRQRDPSNLLLARQARFRLDAEAVRDNALAISGLLSRRIGGPSAKPYQPAGYWKLLNFPTRVYQADKGENQYRRGLYTYWQRTFPHPSLLAFDAPSREECTAERTRSNTPLQALVLLNDPSYVEAARALAERIMREGTTREGTTREAVIQAAYRRALNRPAQPAEVALLTGLFEKHLAQYRADGKSAEAFLRVGDRPAPGDVPVAELAAWTSVARVILNLHETITRN
ncbi:MAG: DUF1553 domain-containing protein [Planctomycetes bacterium]|nr:DUF1553 domain-containing protein [Planctomycetota bacterium]